MVIPDHAHGKCRLSRDELDTLWVYAQERARQWYERTREDLVDLSNTSSFVEAMLKKIKALVTEENEEIARPIMASKMLAQLFHGDPMLEPLEAVDNHLVIDPVFSRADEHLKVESAELVCLERSSSKIDEYLMA